MVDVLHATAYSRLCRRSHVQDEQDRPRLEFWASPHTGGLPQRICFLTTRYSFSLASRTIIIYIIPAAAQACFSSTLLGLLHGFLASSTGCKVCESTVHEGIQIPYLALWAEEAVDVVQILAHADSRFWNDG